MDPHKTQPVIDVTVDDGSYHCSDVHKLDVKHLDPSISLCFFCQTEDEFDSWCSVAKRALILNEKQPLFELAKERLPQWSPVSYPVEVAQDATCLSADSFANYELDTSLGPSHDRHQPAISVESCNEAFSDLEDRLRSHESSDEEFELLG